MTNLPLVTRRNATCLVLNRSISLEESWYMEIKRFKRLPLLARGQPGGAVAAVV
jgi:hypothetical protein